MKALVILKVSTTKFKLIPMQPMSSTLHIRSLLEPLKEELQRMEKLVFIKKCTEPTAWVHSLVVAKKKITRSEYAWIPATSIVHVVVGGEDVEQHECNLKLNREKCHFHVSEVCYVDHVLSADVVKPYPQKVEVINFLLFYYYY